MLNGAPKFQFHFLNFLTKKQGKVCSNNEPVILDVLESSCHIEHRRIIMSKSSCKILTLNNDAYQQVKCFEHPFSCHLVISSTSEASKPKVESPAQYFFTRPRGVWVLVEGRGSRVQSRGSRVICRGSRVLKNKK